ncbi:hypothetical protein [Cellulophaga sp. L1A9]|uniref:hypothetical protein n=1 Tax=Cellulophaga sp. L1A9 TaxID=2686362 RepID=UPI00131C6994|nr:hypothetical protein [Cellulophaga sp. L1A9]
MKKIYLITSMILALAFTSCDDDDDNQELQIIPAAGSIAGGPFTFCVDGVADMVSGITVDDSDAMGTNSTWVITDDQGNILGLPPTVADVEGVDFDAAGAGVCFIWYLRYEDGLTGAEVGMNTANLNGTFDLSNSIMVTRNKTNAGVLTGGPYEFTVDGTPDMVTGLSLDSSDSSGSNSIYVITDADGNILGMPPTLEAVEGVDFDAAGAGVCFIWYLRYEDGLTGAEVGMNANDLEGCFSLSNSVMVTRTQGVNAGVLTGGPYEFCIDGTADMVSGISLDSAHVSGENNSWIITDDQGNILGLPPTLEAVEGVNFDGAGAGVCFIWHLSYNGSITGAEVGMNANDLEGDFDLSNALSVTRSKTEAGVLSGGPYNFTIDGTSDFVSGITLDATDVSGSLSTYVITDSDGKILGMPPTLEAVEGVDFDGAGVGVCLIWYLRYEDGLTGAEVGMNANDLDGCFDLSNAITVNRTMP